MADPPAGDQPAPDFGAPDPERFTDGMDPDQTAAQFRRLNRRNDEDIAVAKRRQGDPER